MTDVLYWLIIITLVGNILFAAFDKNIHAVLAWITALMYAVGMIIL